MEVTKESVLKSIERGKKYQLIVQINLKFGSVCLKINENSDWIEIQKLLSKKIGSMGKIQVEELIEFRN